MANIANSQLGTDGTLTDRRSESCDKKNTMGDLVGVVAMRGILFSPTKSPVSVPLAERNFFAEMAENFNRIFGP